VRKQSTGNLTRGEGIKIKRKPWGKLGVPLFHRVQTLKTYAWASDEILIEEGGFSGSQKNNKKEEETLMLTNTLVWDATRRAKGTNGGS